MISHKQCYDSEREAKRVLPFLATWLHKQNSVVPRKSRRVPGLRLCLPTLFYCLAVGFRRNQFYFRRGQRLGKYSKAQTRHKATRRPWQLAYLPSASSHFSSKSWLNSPQHRSVLHLFSRDISYTISLMQNSSIVDETDPTLPFSTLLRQGTQKSHSRIHRNRRVQLLADGLLDKEEYLKLLFMLWHVYECVLIHYNPDYVEAEKLGSLSTLESCLNTHQSHPQISPWYNPTLHPRKHQISLDISYYLSTEPNSWRALPLFKSYNPSALNEYTTHLLTLSQTRPELLLAHGYTRYLGDLSGGQTIKRSIIKAYGEGVDRKGVKFYDFGTEDEEELKAMKQNFRDGIDRAVGEDTTLKGGSYSLKFSYQLLEDES
jgi:heme oxygenase